MLFEDDADTLPGTDTSDALSEAVEWLRAEGFITGEQRPFARLLRDADEG
jgi:hypothetical protein